MTPGQGAPGAPDRSVEIGVLGVITVQLAGQRIRIGDAKHRLMLAMLVAAEGRQISTAQLISQIWGDDPPRTAPDLIYSYASDLRRNLARGLEGAAQILPRHHGGGYRLAAARSQVDLYKFRDLSSRARSLAGTDPGQAVALWRQAVALWGTGARGDPGDGPFTDLTASAVADCQWLKDYRPALREQYRAALIACYETELRLGEHEQLIPELADLAAADPLDERIAGLLMTAYYRSGRQAQATRLYQSTRERLSTDLGVEPGQQLKELYQKFLNQDPSLDPPERATPQGERITVSAVPASRPKKRAVADSKRVLGLDHPDTLMFRRNLDLARHEHHRPGQHTGWSFQVLGAVSVQYDGVPVDVGGPTARAVLAVLLLRGSAGATATELISSVWGGPGEASRASVYYYIARLRAALSAGNREVSLEARRPSYRLHVEDDAVDWRRFRRLAAHARAARDDRRTERAAALLREALDLWQGPPLADLDDRLEPFRRDMAGQRLAAAEELATIEVYRRARASLAGQLGLETDEELKSAHLHSLHGHQPAGPADTLAAASQPDGSLPRPTSGLPGADRHFTGRDRELDTLVRSVTDQGGQPACVVSGMAGAGKTALVVYAARKVARQFPGGTLFIDLHGNTVGHEPLPPTDALDRLLRRIGMNGDRIPPSVDERAALYRSLLADRRMLILLDDAHDAAQVRPLLPGASGCAVVITSRQQLTALDEAQAMPLDVLEQADAEALFRSIVGADRLLTEPSADTLPRIVQRCGRLPLAIRIAAARHRARPLHTLADLEARMSDAHAALTELEDDDRSVAASFNMSLADLPTELRRSFALLAAHPGIDLEACAAAALIGLPRPEAVRHLDGLVARHLLVEHARGRYRFHDLIAAFARHYALAPMPAAEQAAARRRIIDYSLQAAELADRLITPHRFRIPLDVADRTATLPPLRDYDTALTWFTTEQVNLADACVAAGKSGLDKSCWQLAYTLRGYYFLTKHWQPWLQTHQAALAAARRCGDARAEAMTVNNLGLAHIEQGHHAVATTCYENALRLFAEVHDPHGEQTARANLAWIMFAEHKYTDFLRETRPVLAFYQQTGAERNAAITQRGIGLAEAELGHTDAAVGNLRQALDDFTRLGLHLDAIMTVNGLGETYQRAGDHAHAVDAFESALTSSQRYGSTFEHARARHRLGQLAADAGDRDQARRHWNQALDDYRRLGAPQAIDVQAQLTHLDA
jgi:DNA-binding SARP family transcriptional activator